MTHIRFALDLADRFFIDDMTRYISGTVYPDSRWVSGIDRELTHGEQCTSPDFVTDDFSRGWQVHCICDAVQNMLFEKIFPDFQELPREERWVQLSAAKLIQDMHDLQQFRLECHLQHLDFCMNPNGEEISRVRRFYRVIRNTYSHLRVPTPGEYRQLWVDVGLSGELATRIIEALQKRLQHKEDVRRIIETYPKMCDLAEQDSL